jgi:hypothetical protein
MGWIHSTEDETDTDWRMYNLVGEENFKQRGRTVIPAGKCMLSLYGHEFEYDCKQDAPDGELLVVMSANKFPWAVVPEDIRNNLKTALMRYGNGQVTLEFEMSGNSGIATGWAYAQIHDLVARVK